MDHYPPKSNFDTEGFLFFLKFCALVASLIFIAKYGTIVVATIVFGQDGHYSVATAEVAASEMIPSVYASSTNAVEIVDPVPAKSFIVPEKIENVVPADGKFIAADLDAMQMYLYNNGAAVAEFPIVSKGKKGSRWETPTGMYAIETKEKSHFSSIGEVTMPYSMQFYGNFFIHGWPLYPNGKPVPKGYSGGCIRLSTKDAEKVFSFAEKRTPVYISDAGASGEAPAGNALVSSGMPDDLSAESYLIGDLSTGEVIVEKNSNDLRPIASITKLMSAVVVNEAINFEKNIKIKKELHYVSQEKNSVRAGETFTATELLYPMLMESNNTAAEAFASDFGYGHFISLMNAKAQAIGMVSTQFKDPSGISADNTSTAVDLFKFAQYLFHKQSFLVAATRKASYSVPKTAGHPARSFQNFNVFSSRSDFIGGKTGKTTAAKETMLSLFSPAVSAQTSPHPIVIIVLRSDDRRADTEKLLSWYEKSFEDSY